MHDHGEFRGLILTDHPDVLEEAQVRPLTVGSVTLSSHFGKKNTKKSFPTPLYTSFQLGTEKGSSQNKLSIITSPHTANSDRMSLTQIKPNTAKNKRSETMAEAEVSTYLLI